MAFQNATIFFPAMRFRIEDDRMLQAYVMAIIKSVILHKCDKKKIYILNIKIRLYVVWYKNHDISIDIATCYGLDGSAFEPLVGQEILRSPHPFRPALGPTLSSLMGTEFNSRG